MPSQDMYYSVKGIYDVLNCNKNITNIALCMGYYYFFNDMSKVKNIYELMRVVKVYNKLYQDMHNCCVAAPLENKLPISNIFDVDKVMDLYSEYQYEQGYFNEKWTRRSRATKVWRDKEKNWTDLSALEKEEAGKIRAEQHNKAINNIGSLEENIELFYDLCNYCEKNNINIFIICAPATKYYKQNFNMELQAKFYSILESIPLKIHVLDLFENGELFNDEEDFNDVDHLSKSGAIKMSKLVNHLIYEEID